MTQIAYNCDVIRHLNIHADSRDIAQSRQAYEFIEQTNTFIVLTMAW